MTAVALAASVTAGLGAISATAETAPAPGASTAFTDDQKKAIETLKGEKFTFPEFGGFGGGRGGPGGGGRGGAGGGGRTRPGSDN